MNVKFILRGVELDQAERDALMRKAAFAFDRFDEKMDRLDLVLEDVNGPRGGDDKLCRLILHRVGEPVVILQERGESALATGLAVLERAAQVMSRRKSKTIIH